MKSQFWVSSFIPITEANTALLYSWYLCICVMAVCGYPQACYLGHPGGLSLTLDSGVPGLHTFWVPPMLSIVPLPTTASIFRCIYTCYTLCCRQWVAYNFLCSLCPWINDEYVYICIYIYIYQYIYIYIYIYHHHNTFCFNLVTHGGLHWSY